MQETKLSAGKLEVTVTAQGKHGWCGLSEINHTDYSKPWLLSPAFTLEHYIGIPMDAKDYVEYEPCYSHKMLEQTSSTRCRLRYAQLPCSQIDFTVSYQVSDPHYIDATLEMTTKRYDWSLNHLALFFATIVNAPIYTGVNLLGYDRLVEVKNNDWLHFNSSAAMPGKTAHPAGLKSPELPRPDNAPNTYFYSDSSVRFLQPFFYGIIENMVFATMFRPEDKDSVRFTVNPLAPAFGGPAWDFIWDIPEPIPNKTYSLSFRSYFKPFISQEDILNEYEAFVYKNLSV